jgi:hypothetical protein
MTKVKIINNKVVITDDRGKYTLDKREYVMSHKEASRTFGNKMLNASQYLFLLRNLKEVNKALLEVGGDLINIDTYWCCDQYSDIFVWYVSFITGYINRSTRDALRAVRVAI